MRDPSGAGCAGDGFWGWAVLGERAGSGRDWAEGGRRDAGVAEVAVLEGAIWGPKLERDGRDLDRARKDVFGIRKRV